MAVWRFLVKVWWLVLGYISVAGAALGGMVMIMGIATLILVLMRRMGFEARDVYLYPFMAIIGIVSMHASRNFLGKFLSGMRRSTSSRIVLALLGAALAIAAALYARYPFVDGGVMSIAIVVALNLVFTSIAILIVRWRIERSNPDSVENQMAELVKSDFSRR